MELRCTELMKAPGIPVLRGKSPEARIEFKRQWRGSIFSQVTKGNLIHEADILPKLVTQPTGDDDGTEGDERNASRQRAQEHRKQRARAELRRLFELSQMRDEDELSVAAARMHAKEKYALEVFSMDTCTKVTMPVGSPAWRRRIQYLAAFVDRNKITIRSLYASAQKLRHEEEKALDIEREKRAHHAALWLGHATDGEATGASRTFGSESVAAAKREADLRRAVHAATFRRFCDVLGVLRPDARDKALFDMFDQRKLGLVNLQDMLLMLIHLVHTQDTDRLRLIFFIIDINGDGVLVLEEIKLLLRANWQVEAEWQVEKKARHILEEADVDNNGNVDINEFITYSQRHPDVWLPSYLRETVDTRVRKQKAARSVQTIGIGKQGHYGRPKGRAGGRNSGRGRSRGRGRSQGGYASRGKGRKLPRLPADARYPQLRVQKIVELAHDATANDHVPLPPYREMCVDNSIKHWNIDTSFSLAGNVKILMKYAGPPKAECIEEDQ